MGPFWVMFFVPLWAVLSPRRLPSGQSDVAWYFVITLFCLMIGLRHEVGGDWFGYLSHFNRAADGTFLEALGQGDPGHFGINWLVARMGGSVHAVNLLYALVLMIGTALFCDRQPNRWIALLVAVPYMLIVVGMGYTRQSVALGFALIALVALQDGRTLRFVLWIALAAIFHKSAVLLLPIAALAASKNRWLTICLVCSATTVMYYLVLHDSAEKMWANYVEAEMQSSGGPVRVLMNAIPAILLFIFRKRIALDPRELKLWLWISVFALVCVPLVSLSSTAVDRMALYLIPLQLFVFSRLPGLAGSKQVRTLVVLGILLYYASVQFVWLVFANNSERWLPYQSILWV